VVLYVNLKTTIDDSQLCFVCPNFDHTAVRALDLNIAHYLWKKS